MKLRVSGSRTPLLALCAYPFRDDVQWDADNGSTYASVGTGTHSAIALSINTGAVCDDATLRRVFGEEGVDDEDECAQATTYYERWLESFYPPPPGMQAEVAYAYDPQTGAARKLGVDIGRKYREHGLLDHELAVTVDAVYVDFDTVEVTDWKSGFGGRDVREQLLIGVLAAARAEGVTKGRIRKVQIDERGARVVLLQDVDEEMMAAHEKVFRLRLKAIPHASPQPGPHCRAHFCPALASCPVAQHGATDAMVLAGPPGEAMLEEPRRFRLTTHVESAEHHEWLLAVVDVLRAAIPKVEKALEAYADEHGPVPYSGGRVYQAWPTAGKRSLKLSEKGLAILKEHGLDSVVKKSTTLSALERADKGGAALLALEACGDITRKPGETYEPRRAPAEFVAMDARAIGEGTGQ